jgi:hypothetical protein
LLEAGHDRQQVGKVLTVLLAAFPSQSLSQEAMTARAAGYAMALDGIPTWAVEAAARAWLRGDATEAGQFAPSPPVLCRMAEAYVSKLRNERDGYDRLMTAQVPPPEPVPVSPDRIAELLKPFKGEAA